MGNHRLRAQRDSRLMIKEVNEEFVLKEIALVAYRIAVHKLIKSFSSIQFDHMSRGYKKHADALATFLQS